MSPNLDYFKDAHIFIFTLEIFLIEQLLSKCLSNDMKKEYFFIENVQLIVLFYMMFPDRHTLPKTCVHEQKTREQLWLSTIREKRSILRKIFFVDPVKVK